MALVALTVVGPVTAPAPVSADIGGCDVKGGAEDGRAVPWAQERLDFDRVHQIATGEGVTVAVIDSGLDVVEHPQARRIKITRPTNVLPGFPPTEILDCTDPGHGTGVSAIIAAPRVSDVGFMGLAPDATIMPIKQFDPDVDVSDAGNLAAAITAAVGAGVDVINLSLSIPVDDPAVQAAVRAAGEADVVLVTSSGNDLDADTENATGQHFPAEYADDGRAFAHVLAVGATAPDDSLATTSITGAHVGVSAPGEEVLFASNLSGYAVDSGTSFAAPFVSATAALVRQRYPALSARKVVNRIKATASRPGKKVPDVGYGYGIVNPYLALTAARNDATLTVPVQARPPVDAPARPPKPDRTQQHLAYAVGAGLLGAAALFTVGSAAWRRTSAERRRTSAIV